MSAWQIDTLATCMLMRVHVQVTFIRQQKLGFQSLDSAEFEELRPLLVKVEQGIGNRDFAATLLQGNPSDAFFKVIACAADCQLAACCQIMSMLAPVTCHAVQ